MKKLLTHCESMIKAIEYCKENHVIVRKVELLTQEDKFLLSISKREYVVTYYDDNENKVKQMVLTVGLEDGIVGYRKVDENAGTRTQ